MLLNKHEGVLVYNPSNMFYLSGYTGEGLVLITNQVCAIVTDFRYTEQAENQSPDFQDSWKKNCCTRWNIFK